MAFPAALRVRTKVALFVSTFYRLDVFAYLRSLGLQKPDSRSRWRTRLLCRSSDSTPACLAKRWTSVSGGWPNKTRICRDAPKLAIPSNELTSQIRSGSPSASEIYDFEASDGLLGNGGLGGGLEETLDEFNDDTFGAGPVGV